MKLLPCPFCGGKAKMTSRQNREDFGWCFDVDYWVYCETEGCFVHMGMCETEEEAALAWNRRTPEHVNETTKSEHDKADLLKEWEIFVKEGRVK